MLKQFSLLIMKVKAPVAVLVAGVIVKWVWYQEEDLQMLNYPKFHYSRQKPYT